MTTHLQSAGAQTEQQPIRMVRTKGSEMWEQVDPESFEFCEQDSDYECREFYTAPIAQTAPQHFDDRAVDRFAIAMKAKMAAARAKGRGGWFDRLQCSDKRLARLLVEHLSKGNEGTFEDVAIFAMMLHQRGEDPQVLAEAAEAPIKKERGAALELGVKAMESKTAPQPEQSGLVEALKADRDQLLAAAVFFFGMATGGLEESECGEWDRHEAKIDAALSGSPEGLLRSAQGGAE
tara:strand:+ start:6048 stop:6752 length:705 start_codon:yes stop_codon:yes gene_type:complete